MKRAYHVSNIDCLTAEWSFLAILVSHVQQTAFSPIMEELHLQIPVKTAMPASIIRNFQLGKLRLLRDDPEVVTSQFGTEQESTKDYEGRVIFELFQNAVDRADQVVAIQLTPHTLTVSNDGQPFSIYEGKVNAKKVTFMVYVPSITAVKKRVSRLAIRASVLNPFGTFPRK